MRHGKELHRVHRGGWLRAAVLGANDGIVSTASLVLAVAAAGGTQEAIWIAGIAGLAGGALSMAAGELVSVASQRDLERADLARERRELETIPERELEELAAIYRRRGLSSALARDVAVALTAHDALAAHAREELNIDVGALSSPWQAAGSSAAAFATGGALPLAAIWLSPVALRFVATPLAALAALALLGAWSAALGGAPAAPAVGRVVVGGAVAMALTTAIGGMW